MIEANFLINCKKDSRLNVLKKEQNDLHKKGAGQLLFLTIYFNHRSKNSYVRRS